ncbi:disease resistance protein [Diplodia corticola]|uniref:Disease resistance protein n=1 Tax=Diplodia corticola TaxID=236234 RepID=A0A1J9QX55_9PEZI|nr:disease resistance protein [Diplodia corticola]OJD32984.1 disease resistance protein [Diplodia corticola]
MGDHTAFFYGPSPPPLPSPPAFPTLHPTHPTHPTNIPYPQLGTLMVPKVLHRVIYGTSTPEPWQTASLRPPRPALLHAHQRRKVRHADYPGVIPLSGSGSSSSSTSTGSSVRGTLVAGLTDADMYRLDLFEGDEYERRRVRVRVLVGGDVDAAGLPSSGGGGGGREDGKEQREGEAEEVEAETYIWTAGERRLEDHEWDFGEFVREKLRFWVGEGASHEYADVDKAVSAESNGVDGTGGRGANGAIGKALDEDHKTAKETLRNAV